MYFVYILYSESLDTYYIGETEDIEARIGQHNSGYYIRSFTSQVEDWELFLKNECKDRGHSRKIETHIKRMKNKKYVQDLKKYPEMISKLLGKYK